jgi:hypothetical protein
MHHAFVGRCVDAIDHRHQGDTPLCQIVVYIQLVAQVAEGPVKLEHHDVRYSQRLQLGKHPLKFGPCQLLPTNRPIDIRRGADGPAQPALAHYLLVYYRNDYLL